MTYRILAGRRVGLHFDSDHLLGAELGENVNLVASGLLPQVVKAGSTRAGWKLGPNLRGHKGVEDPTEEIAVSERRVDVEAKGSADQSGIDDVLLRRPDKPLESVRRPCRKRLDYGDVMK